MNSALLCFGLVAILSAATARAEFYSDLTDDEYKKIQELAYFLENKLEGADATGGISENEPELDKSSKANAMPAFDYSVDQQKDDENVADSTVFAVGPSDSRYFQGFRSPVRSDEFEDDYSSGPSQPRFKDVKASSAALEASSGEASRGDPDVVQVPVGNKDEDGSDFYFTAIVAGCSGAAVVSTIVIGISCYRLHKYAKAAANVDYPAYGVTGPNKDISPTSGDRRLAQSAQMYHYQHQKQQILAMESSMNNKDRRSSVSDAESEEENEEGDYTVYECPGLAPTGEMEVKNPLFNDDRTPGTLAKSVLDSNEGSQGLPK